MCEAEPTFNFNALLALGASGYGGAEVGEVRTVVNTINKSGLSAEPQAPGSVRVCGRHPSAREIPRAASRTAGINAGTWASCRGTTTDTAAATVPPAPRTAAATERASSVT